MDAMHEEGDVGSAVGSAVKWGSRQRVKWILQDNGVRAVFRTGAVRLFELSQLNSALIERLTLHGLKQKLADACADNDEAGQDVTSVDALWAQLRGGEWASVRSESSMLAEAAAEVTGQEMGKVVETLQKMDKKDKAALARNVRIAAVLDRIRAEKRKADSGMSDGKLDELFGAV